MHKTNVVAALQLATAVWAAVLGYVVVLPRAGQWGLVFTVLAALLALYWLVVLGLTWRASGHGGQPGGDASAAAKPRDIPGGRIERPKVERALLTGLAVGVLACSAWMAVGVIGLARHEGPRALGALLEVAAFVGVAVVPLRVRWSRATAWLAVWAGCLTYVTVLALNALRLGLYLEGALRLALWIALAALFLRLRDRRPV